MSPTNSRTLRPLSTSQWTKNFIFADIGGMELASLPAVIVGAVIIHHPNADRLRITGS